MRLLRRAGVAGDLYLPKVYLKRQQSGNPEHEFPGASQAVPLKPYRRDVFNHVVNRLGWLGPLSPTEHRIGRGYGLVQAQTCNEVGALRIKRRYGVPYTAMTTGADLSEVAVGSSRFSRLYRQALTEAEHVFLVNVDQFDTLERTGLTLKSYSFLPFCIDLERLRPLPNRWSDPVVLFCAARLDWRSRVRPSIKANDIFFRGLASCLQQPGSRFDVRVADWGVDREATRDLVSELGLDDCVQFVPSGDKRLFYQNVQQAHIVIDQFSLGAVGLTTIEAMALGRPVMAFVRDDLAQRAYGVNMPVINCATVDQVRDALVGLTPDGLERASQQSAAWVNTYHSDERILDILDEVYRGILG
jgi:glycosyltransferase involved in cell wall biosynthesis